MNKKDHKLSSPSPRVPKTPFQGTGLTSTSGGLLTPTPGIYTVPYPEFVMRHTWRKDETLRTPIKRVIRTEYSCVKRKITLDGRYPHKEKIRNSMEIEKMAKDKGNVVKKIQFSYFPKSRNILAYTLMSEVT